LTSDFSAILAKLNSAGVPVKTVRDVLSKFR
jgi:hypothetical protein